MTLEGAFLLVQSVRKHWIDFKYLWLEQMTEIQANWVLYLMFSVLLPVIMIFGFTHIGSGSTDQTSLLYIISGVTVFSLASDGIYGAAVRVGEMRKENALIYYSTLPINRFTFMLALMGARLIVTVPGMIVPIIVGKLFYDFQIQPHICIVLLLPLISLTFAGVGLMIGAFIENLGVVQIVINTLLFVLVMASPVFIPAEKLPMPVYAVSLLLPTTYAAEVLRAVLLNRLGFIFYIHVSVLLALICGELILLERYWNLR